MSASVAAILMLILRVSTFNWTPEPELASSQTGSWSLEKVSQRPGTFLLRQPWTEAISLAKSHGSALFSI